MIVESHANAPLHIELEGEEASLFAQLLLELHNFNNNSRMASPGHIGLVLLKKLERDGEISVAQLASASEASSSYGYEDAYYKLRAWMSERCPLDNPEYSLWEEYKAENGILERGAISCEATDGAYFCLLEPGHPGKHRWGRSR